MDFSKYMKCSDRRGKGLRDHGLCSGNEWRDPTLNFFAKMIKTRVTIDC